MPRQRPDLLIRLDARCQRALLAAAAALALVAGGARAERLRADAVPEPLRPWVAWALHGHEEALCPALAGSGERACVWPGVLTLELDAAGGRFSQAVRVDAPSFAPLPGDGERWPEDVRAGERALAVVEHDGRPAVRLEPGVHELRGAFRWPALPALLPVSPETGLVALRLEGRDVALPDRDESGRLWLRARDDAPGAGERRVELEVHRRLVDDVPLRLETRVTLHVSGPPREELVGPPLPAGFAPLRLESALPARLEPGGALRVQLRPGRFELALDARAEGRPDAFSPLEPAARDGAWAASEVWVFEARPALRLVTPEGDAVDPQQTTLPPEWRSLPAFRMEPGGAALRLVERRRGDAEPAPDALTLARSWHLDFDGGGATVSDRLEGTLRARTRLEMGVGTELGRASVNGADQFLTRRGEGAPVGIQLPPGPVVVAADSRVEGGVRALPAVSWAHDVAGASATLELPPGWRLVHAAGVDRAEWTWWNRWTLLDLFFALVAAVAFARLYGAPAGALAALALALTYTEAGAPRVAWLALLAAEALCRAVPAGRFARALRLARVAALAWLVVIAVPFAVSALRAGLYPALVPPGAAPFGLDTMAMQGKLDDAVAREQAPATEAEAGEGAARSLGYAEADAPEPAAAPAPAPGALEPALPRPDPDARITTGPGLPTWSWERVTLTWSGPVERDRTLRLFLLPPGANALLAAARVALVAALLAVVARGLRRRAGGDAAPPGSAAPPPAPLSRFADAAPGTGPAGPPGASDAGAPGASGAGGAPGASDAGAPASPGGRPDYLRGASSLARRVVARLARARTLAVVLLALSAPSAFLASGPVRAELPTPELLEELRGRLLDTEPCEPACVALPRLRLDARAGALRLELTVDAAAEAALPLPGSAASWLPAEVRVGGEPARALRRDAGGTLWLRVAPGVSTVTLSGPLPPGGNVALPLPLVPHRGEAALEGYDLFGLRPDGGLEPTLQLVRQEAAPPDAGPAPVALPPFVRVERALALGLTWESHVRVRRLSPADEALILEVPLLAGESVTTPGLEVREGRVRVSLAPGADTAGWSSVLAVADSIELAAPEGVPWTEAWSLRASPIWHVTAEGIPPVQADPTRPGPDLAWRPWPGERVRLAIERPAGVGGATRTLDASRLVLRPGVRSTDAELALTLRSSQGGEQRVTLPEGAELLRVAIDGREQPIRQEGRGVVLPLVPGTSVAELAWREPRGLGLRWRGPEVDVGVPGVNAEVEVQPPAGRWLLYASGPPLGPAVLFWPLLAVYLVLAALLGRTRLAPLGTLSWALLALGLTQVSVPLAALVPLWLLALGWRRARGAALPGRWLDAVQVGLALLTFAALAALLASIRAGLLGLPEMQIAGNGSSAELLRWYQDRTEGTLPQPALLSLPLGAYRALMLLWALWIAQALVGWLRFGWTAVSTGELWRPLRRPRRDLERPMGGTP